LVWIAFAPIACLATGCSTPLFPRANGRAQPAIGSQPGPVKQLAAAVGATSAGQKISNAFKPSKASEDPTDPVSLKSKTAPVTPDTYVKLAKISADSGDIEGAREAYHKALTMKPHHLGALLGLGRVFESQGQLDRASKLYLEATQNHPNDASAFNDLGWCYARMRHYDAAVAALSRAVELKPDRELYRNNIAAVLVKLNRTDEAMAHLADARGDAVAHYNLGCLLHEENRDQAALKHFQLALRQQPTFEAAQQWIASLSAAPAIDERGLAAATDGHDGSADERERQASWSANEGYDDDLAADTTDEWVRCYDDCQDQEVETAESDDDCEYVTDEPEPQFAENDVSKRRGPISDARSQPLPPSSRRGRGTPEVAASSDDDARREGVEREALADATDDDRGPQEDERGPILEARLQRLPPRMETLPSRLQSLPPLQDGQIPSRY
jgi:tetratricopeptide (TPR) repeat protein